MKPSSLSDSQDEIDGADVNTTALANAAGVLAGLGSPITEGGGPVPSSSKVTSDNTSKPPLTLHFENGDSPIACWPQPLQTVLYRSNGVDMLLYLFEFVTACEASVVSNTANPPSSTSQTQSASYGQSETSSEQGETSGQGGANNTGYFTPPTSARQSIQIGSAASTAPSTPSSPPDTSMALLVLRCIRAILRSNPQAYIEFGEKNAYSVACHVLKRFPAQLSEEKIKLFFDIVGVVPNGFTGPSYSSSPSEEVMASFMSNFDTVVLSTLPKPVSESLWSLALHQVPAGSLSTGTLSNIVAFKNFFMDYRMWRKAPLRLQEVILDYTDRLIQGNLLYQFNVARMRKAHMLAHLLNMLREEGLDMSLFLRVVGLISDLLVAHHTEKDLQHMAGFLIHTFHLQNNPAPLPNAAAGSKAEPIDAHARLDQLAIRFDILRNMVMNVIFYLVADAENKSFYEKVFDPDWINLFVAQEANPDTVTTALKIMAQLYYGSSSYSLRVEKTNALKHFAAIFPVFHSHVPLYYYLFGMTLGKPPTDLPERIDHFDFSALLEVFKLQSAEEEYPIVCRGALEVIFAMIKAGSEAYIDLNDANLPTSASTAGLVELASGGGSSGTTSSTPLLGRGSQSSSSDNLLSASETASSSMRSSISATQQSDDSESPRGAMTSSTAEGIMKSSSATALSSSPVPFTSPSSRRMSADVSAELSRRRASSMAIPRPGGTSTTTGAVTTANSFHESTIDEDPESTTSDDLSNSSSSNSAAPTTLGGLAARNLITSTQGMGTALLNAFKGIKSSRRKSTVISSFVPQQVIGGTMSGASATARSQPKFQDKFHLYTPPLYYQEQSMNMGANFAPHRSLLQFIKHIFSRSSAMQDLIRKGDLAHHILTILFPHGRLNMPISGAAWGSSANASPINLSVSSPSPTSQSGADQWSLLIMDFLSHVLIQQAILNPSAAKDSALLLHEIFEVAPPIFTTHADLSRFNAVLLHFLYDQVRPKLNIWLASTAHNQLPKLLAPLARFCSFAIDRVSCAWVQPSTASLTLNFITDVISTVQDKMDEENRKKTLSSKDASSIKNELNQFTKCLNRLVLWMLQDALRDKLTATQSTSRKMEVLGKIMAHKRLILAPSNNDKDFYATLCKSLHTLLTDTDSEVRIATIATWKLLLHDKLDQVEFGLVYKSPKGETIDLRQHGFLILIQPVSHDAPTNVNVAFTKWFRDNSMIISTIFEDTFGRIAKNYWANELKLLEERKSMSRKNIKLRTMKSQKMDDAEKISLDRIMEDNARLKQRILQAETLRFHQSKQAVIEVERYYNRKWAQRRLTLFHELHIWGATPMDPETDSPLHPGLAPSPHPLHKWMLDYTEGPNRMRSKTRRNYDFYNHYPYDPSNLQASASGPIIYPTRTPQSTSAKDFDSLSNEERILVDRNFYIERAIRRHQAMATAQLSIYAKNKSAIRKSAKIPIADEDDDSDDGDDASSEDLTSSRTGSLASSLEKVRAKHSSRRKSKKQAGDGSGGDQEDGFREDGVESGEDDSGSFSESSSRTGSEKDVFDEEDEEEEEMDPEQAAFEGLQRLGKMIPADRRNLRSTEGDDDDPATAGGAGTTTTATNNTASQSSALTGSGRRRSVSMTRNASKTSVASEKGGSTTGRGERKRGETITEKQERTSMDSDDDTGHDASLIDDDAVGGDATLKKNLEDVVAATQMPEMEMESDEGDQKLKRLLQPGDEPTDMYNCGRVVGLDKKEGIFVICENNAYFIQDYHITKDHELIEVLPAAGASAGSTTPRLNDQARRVIRWAHEDVEQVLRRRYLLRPVAIEIFSVDGRNSLLVFDFADRERVITVMGIKQQAVANRIANATGVARSAKSLKLSLKESTDLWTSGQISNFEYLMRLNTIAGRSYNDLTQYPVFPWIVADYKSQSLDLSNPASFRDLTKPMGALGEERREKLLERYEMLDDSVPKFHYGSHYSSAAIVLHYLIRLEPMTQQFLTLQGGRFDRPDRLFESIGDSWIAASSENPMDVKELVPEFFYLPEAFHNSNNFIFGRKQTGDEAFIDDVILPPWANGDAHTFVRLNRQALESPYVSENLHHWIDLIFGHKQQGPAAEQAMNLFYYLTYEGAVDIDKIQDQVEKQGIIDQINNFGQTPTQLFKKPHPKRQVMPKIAPSLFGVSTYTGQYGNVVGGSVANTFSGTLSSPTNLHASSSSNPATSGTMPRITTGDSGYDSASSTGTNPASTPTTPLDAPTSFGSPKSSSTSNAAGDSATTTSDGPAQLPGSGKIPSASSSTSGASNPVSAVASESPVRTVIGCSVVPNKGVPIGSSIGQICCGHNNDKFVALEMMKIALPGHLHRRIAWGYDDLALRFWDGDKLVLVVPNTFHRSGIVSCVAISADGKFVVTGGTDAVLCVFRLDWEARRPHFALASTGSVTSKLTGHCAPIAHVTVSRAFSMIVSSDTMGQVLIWDLNTFQFVRTLCGPAMAGSPHAGALHSSLSSGLTSAPYGGTIGTPRSASKRLQIYHEHQYSVDGDIRASMAEASVEDGLAVKPSSKNIDIIRIDDSNGYIYTSSQGNLCIWDVNGELLAQEEVSMSTTVSSFTTTHCPDWMEGVNFIIIGLKDGTIKVYRRDNSPRLEGVAMIDGKWPPLPPSRLLLHTIFENRHKAPVTALCLSPNQKKLYSGDANGVLLKWEEIKVSDTSAR
jgi:hypothetical protein